MTRGSTPTHVFTLPFGTDIIKTIEITYAQKDVVKVRKTNEDCTFEGNTVSTKLTQEETFKFSVDAVIEMQIRVLTIDGDAIPSNIMYDTCNDSLSDEVLK